MRILYFIDGLIAGGKERRLTQLMKALRPLPDIEFELVLMNDEVHYQEVLDWNINIHYLVRRTKKDISIFRKFYKICREFRPDMVHCWDGMTAIFAIPVCTLLNIKLINGMVVDTPVNNSFISIHMLRARLTFLFSAKVIGNSNAGLHAYKPPVNRSLCIYNGIDLSRFNNLRNPDAIRAEVLGDDDAKCFVVGMVAAFEDRKDYVTLIKAAKQLLVKHANLRFVLVGGGLNFDKIRNSVPGDLSRQIIFLGKRTDVETVVNIFDVGVLLTNRKIHGEGISNSILEYMALGKPVIATRGGGTDEVVIDRENGFLVDAENEEQLMNYIEILMRDQKMKMEMGENGRQMVKEKFDLAIMAERYLSCYRSLMK